MTLAYFADPDTGASTVPFGDAPVAHRPTSGLPLVLATMRWLVAPTAAKVSERSGLSVRQVRALLAEAREQQLVGVVKVIKGNVPIYVLTPSGLRVARGEP